MTGTSSSRAPRVAGRARSGWRARWCGRGEMEARAERERAAWARMSPGSRLDEVDWDEINNEVEAAMNESDDDGDEGAEGDARSVRSGFSEDESWTDESNSIIR
ncbi:hypothetical protein NUW54_g4743 [Trametes sanguinea]|uniref:Uncharacterized protein n=1 Tax=Trametes sanguinea TaxID=158606 RepID=A0ACC1PYR1_9APHY|nr:hypothetical protein NUW54_g4743 [Trametes sanguinea]